MVRNLKLKWISMQENAPSNSAKLTVGHLDKKYLDDTKLMRCFLASPYIFPIENL